MRLREGGPAEVVGVEQAGAAVVTRLRHERFDLGRAGARQLRFEGASLGAVLIVGRVEGEDVDEAAVQTKLSEVEQEMPGVSTNLYEAAAAEMAEQQADDGDEDVVEADFEVVDSDDDE